MGDILLLAGAALVGAAVGLVVGRWWALLAVLFVPVAFIPAGENPDGMPYWEIATYAFTLPVLLGLAVGVGTRKDLARRGVP